MLFDIAQKLILDQNHEILNVSTIEWTLSPWMRSSLLHDKVLKWAKAKVHVVSDSVLCLGKMQEHSEATKQWKDQLQYFQQSNEYTFFGIDGEPIEFECNIFPGVTTLQILKEIKNKMEACQAGPEHFEDRIIFMPMFNDIDWTKVGKSAECFSTSEKVQNYARRFQLGHWSFLAPGEEKWYGTHNCKPEGKWNTTADVMMDNFKDSVLNRGFLKRKGGRCTIHFNAESSKAEPPFRTFSRAAQYLRSSGELARRIDSADTWSIALEHGQISREGD